MTSDGESVPMVTTLGNTVDYRYTSSTNDSNSESIGNAPWETEEKEPSITKKQWKMLRVSW